MNIENIDTPSILIDYEKLEKNIKDMQSFANTNNLAIRPMIKTHKIPEIAKMQINNGALGITCAKIGEAEIMAEAGIEDIFIAYEIVSKSKVERLIDLNGRIRLTVAVDSIYGVDILNDAFRNKDVRIKVMIEINSGLNRCGLENFQEIYELAKYINEKDNVELVGIFTHAGHVYGATDEKQVERIGREEGRLLVDINKYLNSKGINLKTLSTGSTPTARISGRIPGINEVRPGNYVFYDATQHLLGVVDAERCALTVIATVISKPSDDRAVIDAGSKTLGLDKGAHGVSNIEGYGIVKNFNGVTIERLSEEHGILKIENEGKNLKIGDRVEIIPNHACTVINLFDEAYITKDQEIIDVYKIKARGMLK